MASPSVSRGVRQKKASQTKGRTGWLPSFNYRRPFDALWGLFSSVRAAIVVIAALALLSVVGMLIPQAPQEVLASSQDYAGWMSANVQPQFNNLTGLMDWLQLFTIFHSWYFKALIALLAVSILIGGMLNRAPSIWQKFRHPQLQRADNFYINSPVKVGLTVGDAGATTDDVVTGLRGFFRKRGYQVVAAPASSSTNAYLYVHKNAWSALATFVFHTSLIGIMFCAIMTGWGGFGANSMAARVLPRPVYNYFQDLAGFSYDQPLPNGAQGVVYPLGTDHNVWYRAQNFVAVFDPVRQQPTDFYTDLQLFQDGKMVAQKRIRVNDALSYQGVTFHQASFMMYSDITLRDAQGNVMYSSQIPLMDHNTTPPDPNTGNVFQANNADNVPIATYGEYMNLSAIDYKNAWLVLAKGFDQNNQQVFQGGAIFQQGCFDPTTNAPADAGQYGCKLSNGWSMQVNDIRRGTVLLITKDSGSPLLWPVLLLLVLSLWATFSFPPRRFWVHIEGDQVRMAALKEHYINIQRDLDTFARALGNRALRPETLEPEPPPAAKPPKKDAANKKDVASVKRREIKVLV